MFVSSVNWWHSVQGFSKFKWRRSGKKVHKVCCFDFYSINRSFKLAHLTSSISCHAPYFAPSIHIHSAWSHMAMGLIKKLLWFSLYFVHWVVDFVTYGSAVMWFLKRNWISNLNLNLNSRNFFPFSHMLFFSINTTFTHMLLFTAPTDNLLILSWLIQLDSSIHYKPSAVGGIHGGSRWEVPRSYDSHWFWCIVMHNMYIPATTLFD